jgi:hypothetical protein
LHGSQVFLNIFTEYILGAACAKGFLPNLRGLILADGW